MTHLHLFFQVYHGLKYKLSLEFPSNYPYTAPTVKFTTSCYHPNVDKFGNICLAILKERWSSAYDVKSLLLSLQSLLGGKRCNCHIVSLCTRIHIFDPIVAKWLKLSRSLAIWQLFSLAGNCISDMNYAISDIKSALMMRL